MAEIKEKLAALALSLSAWDKSTFGSVCKQIRTLKRELEILQGVPGRVGPSHRELKIKENLIELYHREELMWRQRARVDWLRAGDKNTRFFHLRASMRRRKNLIKLLVQEDGNLTEDIQTMKDMVNSSYGNLYTSEGVHDMEEVLNTVLVKVTAQMNEQLNAPYTAEEVKTALFQMAPTKAPGPDGFPAHFFQHH